MTKRKSKMGRPPTITNGFVMKVRFNIDELEKVKEIAEIETTHSGKRVTAAELIRQAVTYVYQDGERMRESFRRTRLRKGKGAY